MGRLIPFYIPEGFKPQRKWLPASALGRILQFRPAEVKQSAWRACLQRSQRTSDQLQLRPKGLAWFSQSCAVTNICSPALLAAREHLSRNDIEVSYGRSEKQVRTPGMQLSIAGRQQVLQSILPWRTRDGGTGLQLRPCRLCGRHSRCL